MNLECDSAPKVEAKGFSCKMYGYWNAGIYIESGIVIGAAVVLR